MPRTDLLSLTPDDLAAMTNRGTVKRAQRELESGEATFELAESEAGEVVVRWSDQAVCTLPAGRSAAEGRCNCPSTTLCRHVVRSVLAYQKHAAGGDAAPAPPPGPWDPGSITDDQLAAAFKKATLDAARARYQQGLLVELVRSAKPTARFHQLACVLRFVVPHDLRYTHCDCAEPAPCSHVPLAVWAFRELAAGRESGLVSTQQDDPPVPAELLDAGEELLRELAVAGLSGVAAHWKDRLLRLEPAYLEAELIWPAEVLIELVQQYERYASRDARFLPERVAELVGEWLIRADAIRGRTRATPQLLIRGSSSDRATEIGSARYVGLGCGVAVDRTGVTVTAFMQDADSGSVAAVSRDFADPKPDSGDAPRDFSRLAETPVVKGVPLIGLGGGQLLIQGGKRAADHRLVVGRAKASAQPQGWAWENLRSPVLVEDYAELRARIAALPPASLRPRYVAEGLHVLPVASVDHAGFDPVSQSTIAVVADARGERAVVSHPYLARGAGGTDALLHALADPSRTLKFVAGQARPTSGGLVVAPTCLVFESAGRRTGVQPWVDRSATAQAAGQTGEGRHDAAGSHAEDFPAQLTRMAGDALLLGLGRADARVAGVWAELASQGESLGFTRLVRPVREIADEVSRRLASTSWSADRAAELLLHICMLAKLAHDTA
jgi:hypothetical protein